MTRLTFALFSFSICGLLSSTAWAGPHGGSMGGARGFGGHGIGGGHSFAGHSTSHSFGGARGFAGRGPSAFHGYSGQSGGRIYSGHSVSAAHGGHSGSYGDYSRGYGGHYASGGHAYSHHSGGRYYSGHGYCYRPYNRHGCYYGGRDYCYGGYWPYYYGGLGLSFGSYYYPGYYNGSYAYPAYYEATPAVVEPAEPLVGPPVEQPPLAEPAVRQWEDEDLVELALNKFAFTRGLDRDENKVIIENVSKNYHDETGALSKAKFSVRWVEWKSVKDKAGNKIRVENRKHTSVKLKFDELGRFSDYDD